VHPEFGTREFSIGPCADAHAQHPKENPAYHRFFRDRGGFLSASTSRKGDRSVLAIRLHDVSGNVMHEWTSERPRGRSSEQGGHKFRLMIDDPRHVHIVEKRADLVIIENAIVKGKNDPAYLGESAILLK
jgi:hypothetical protein